MAQEAIAAGEIVLGTLRRVEVGDGIAHDRMAIYPIFGTVLEQGEVLSYRTLDEAIAEGLVTVTEQRSATVPSLVLQNRGKTMVLIVGGNQNRIVASTILVAPESTVDLSVSCVEQGRWHKVSSHFSSGETGFFNLRRAKQAFVRESLRRTGRPKADQWEA